MSLSRLSFSVVLHFFLSFSNFVSSSSTSNCTLVNGSLLFKCNNNNINISCNYHCDYLYQCLDKSDEIGCFNCDNNTQYTCNNSSKCINYNQLCDNKIDCYYADDEKQFI